ncbi:hypothetical protein A3G67_03155 [Candidatus Roizmanbacteria bacterium RIFCSPLOWO2_12_FULL_40_12]|uniref:Methyltransferase type 11 domain-containing protein n=1 Tax=Candidatus Roizmanbacteria bacterium RIFCSPLOWO2_01_FULL_40_42 TaxID=1802066 RepID=A0A1F7J5D9_9BACT|nr:MAG: hypothetical protein A2779_02790 [Candidatus Roizmanbacteria bacterium RIFCSPHIGHO2_01_FULL_40_98]OGK28270.1 MAG: hypothetical protein A3C31_00155 [Candidatus Roizmanbacteria bacterium RIFCSPHIGHO2_02_FULL_40_53]OGK30506.1 MAG: hypothetical protein A2W49_02840 [Candidatus Roizmanbacteria bacterium RIFCSPHIGHO2_12_41_18]OGK36920.1 MAG: hypothetical protein A3E69_00415 [Candidatus Roizmanbacteria bacterium RIFCSPHIGHO2_12_FULL_40_130]OGK50826.1 MAG: hypothetical protein A3B50_00925 [Candi
MARNFNFDFDIHKKNSYMYFWTQEYMIATYEAAYMTAFNFKGKTILDVGVGRGRTFEIYKALGIKDVVGIDVERKEVKYTPKQARKVGLNLKLVLDSPSNIGLQKIPDKSYEVIALMNILFCLPDDESRFRIINEVKRILKPRGVLIVLDMQRPSLMWLISTMFWKNWKFRSKKELIEMFKPLRLISYKPSNHFYSINIIADAVGKLFGPKVFYKLESLFRFLRIPGSTRSFVFKK